LIIYDYLGSDWQKLAQKMNSGIFQYFPIFYSPDS